MKGNYVRPHPRLVLLIRSASPALLLLASWSVASWLLGSHRLPGPLYSLRLLLTSAFSDPIISAQGGGSWGYAPHIFSTLWHVGVGASGGILLGVAIALLAAQHITSVTITNTVLELARTLPPLIFVPFAAIGFGVSDWVQVISVALYSSLTIALYTLLALDNLQPSYLQLSELLGANAYRRIITVQLPGILPDLVGPVRLVLAFGLGISIVVEYLASPTGIGRVMKNSMAFSNIDLIMVGVLWTVALAIFLDVCTAILFGALLNWTDRRQLLEWMAK